MVYLDYAATCPVYPEIIKNVPEISEKYFFNPSSLYRPSVITRKFFDSVRNSLGIFLSCKSENILFMSSATEACNTVIKGLDYTRRTKIVTWPLEHSAIINTLQKCTSAGMSASYAINSNKGYIEYKDIKDLIDHNTKLLVLMHVNNEIGSINHIEEIAERVKKFDNQILIFSDIVQSHAKIHINLENIDFACISGHKVGGLKGCGVLYVKNKDILRPLIEGGGQEFGIRSGTENTLGAYALLEGSTITKAKFRSHWDHLLNLNNMIKDHCKTMRFHINSPENRVPYIFNFSTMKLPSEVMINALSSKNIYVSSASACSGKKKSRVLTSMGFKSVIVDTAIRISLHPDTEEDDIKYFLTELDFAVNHLSF